MYKIKALREEQNIAQIELARRVGVSQPYLHDLENNKRGARQETLEKIAAELGVKVEDLEA